MTKTHGTIPQMLNDREHIEAKALIGIAGMALWQERKQ